VQVERGVTAQWDRRRMTQVVVNLLSNAVKYAPHSQIELSSARRGDQVEISVCDTGPGISPENQATIFERFERAGASPNVGGLGLGLFIARRIVEAHEGTIRVESQLGAGARFVVELPLVPSRRDLQAELG
jgi:signal transduction histidine kinase